MQLYLNIMYMVVVFMAIFVPCFALFNWLNGEWDNGYDD